MRREREREEVWTWERNVMYIYYMLFNATCVGVGMLIVYTDMDTCT